MSGSAHLCHWGDSDSPTLIAIHGFADEGAAFSKLGASPLSDVFELVAPDLPGFGASPILDRFEPTLDGYADFTLALADAVSPNEPVGLIAHSVGSAIAVKAALQRPGRVAALMSIEGNLTAQDAYFSSRAADYATPAEFKPAFERHVAGLTQTSPALARYLTALRRADPTAMWRLGQDAAEQGPGNRFGDAFLSLTAHGLPTLYYWGRHNTPSVTADFIDAHRALNAVEFHNTGHWVFYDAPEETADAAARFFGDVM